MSSYRTTMEREAAKEAPAEYVEGLLRRIWPGAVQIVNVRRLHLPGEDWRVYWKTGNYALIDDKNDLWLGLTGRISLDEKTLQVRDCLQLFINYPRFKGKYMVLLNSGFPGGLTPAYVEREADETVTRSTDGHETRCHIIKVSKIRRSVLHCHPSVNWFTRKRKGGG